MSKEINRFFLAPEDAKSFYKKAYVIEYDDGKKDLYSYDTCVGRIHNGKFTRFWDGYSATTMRHVNAFIHHYGIKGGGKKWWDSMQSKFAERYRVILGTGFASRPLSTIFGTFEEAEAYANKLTKRNPHLIAIAEEVESA